MAHLLENLLPGFETNEAIRKQQDVATTVGKVGMRPGPALGLMMVGAAAEPDVAILSIEGSHLVGSGVQTIKVPVGLNSGGTALYIDHKLWPTLDSSLIGQARQDALRAIMEQLSNQRTLSNCYALSALNCAIWMAYQRLAEGIVALPDGTIGVYGFYQGDVAQPVTFVMDYNLANTGVSIGPAGFIAYKAFEKMWAFSRYLKKLADGTLASTNDDYLAENFGWMDSVLSLLFGKGVASNIIATAATFVSMIQSNIDAGKGVMVGTNSNATNGWIGSHAYLALKTVLPPDVIVKLFGVNPWGVAYPPMYLQVTQADIGGFVFTVCVADFSKALAVQAQTPLPTPTPTEVNPMIITVTNGSQVLKTTDQISLAPGVIANIAWQSDADKWTLSDNAWSARNQSGAGNGQTGPFTVSTPHLLTITFSKAGVADVVYTITVATAAPAPAGLVVALVGVDATGKQSTLSIADLKTLLSK